MTELRASVDVVWGLPRCVWARESTAPAQGNQSLSRELRASALCPLLWDLLVPGVLLVPYQLHDQRLLSRLIRDCQTLDQRLITPSISAC